MDETSGQIERKIRETRNDLSDNISELEEKVKTVFDWRAQFEEHPAAMVGLAFGGGMLLSALLPSVRSSSRRSPDWTPDWSAAQDRDFRVEPVESPANAQGQDRSQTSENWDALKGALVGVAVSRLSGYIEEFLPGFKREFDKAKSGNQVERAGPSSPGQPAWQKSAAAGAD
jgi:hypothetical protein